MEDEIKEGDERAKTTLTLQRMEHGGYLVWPFAGLHDYREPVFACTTIDEAFEFMRGAIAG